MKCPNHSKNEVTGYCSVCGDLGCRECLTEHEGNLLCRKHYRPIAKKLEDEKKQFERRKRFARQRLVVRYKDKRRERGVSFNLSPQDEGFNLDLVDDAGKLTGESHYVNFDELKAVFYVKSFDGRFDKSTVYKEWIPEGKEMVVKFQDGEVIRGFSLHLYRGDEPRFYLIPNDPESNNISILVERSAVEAVYLPEEYEAERARRKEERKKAGDDVAEDLSQEETTGDFYFDTRNYTAALQQYESAARKYPMSRRLRKKLLVTRYNVGVHHIKRHEYEKALECMEAVLKADPQNSHAMKKATQLRRVMNKMNRAKDQQK